jgi:hypothetical protein
LATNGYSAIMVKVRLSRSYLGINLGPTGKSNIEGMVFCFQVFFLSLSFSMKVKESMENEVEWDQTEKIETL